MNEKYAVRRLETMLRVWEQTLFVANAEVRVAKPESFKGAIANWNKFRTAVLNRNSPLDMKMFEMPMDQFLPYFVDVVTYDHLPQMFASWCRSSRRAYSLSEDMQRDLELTSVSGVTWNELNAPFPCFIISLPLPIPGMFDNLIDTLVVEIEQGYMRITAMGNELDAFKPMPQDIRNGIASASHHQNLRKLIARTQLARANGHCYIPANQYVSIICNQLDREVVPDRIEMEDVKFTTVIRAPTEEEKIRTLRFWLPIYRIVIGLCIHLQNLQEENKDATIPVENPGMPLPTKVTVDPNAVIEASQLSVINCGHALTEEELRIHEIIRRVGSLEALRELGAHFRSAYRRRPAGRGDDPTARKSVKVRWTVVNEGRLPAHALPAGSLVTVK